MNKKTLIAGLFITGISLVITATGAFIFPDLLEQPGGLAALFLSVFIALAGLLGGTIREWAANLFGMKKTGTELKRQLNVGDNNTNVVADKFIQNIFKSDLIQENFPFTLFTPFLT